MNRSIDLKRAISLFFVALGCFTLSPTLRGVNPPPDGNYGPPTYGAGNTAEGQNALLSLTSGTYNTAVGFSSLKSNTIGRLNTAIGVNALTSNTIGINNTANGVNALYYNTTGYQNTANGAYALFGNTIGITNTALGAFALSDNNTGSGNTAVGQGALLSNVTGSSNTAIGEFALWDDNFGSGNTAVGSAALSTTNGEGNTAVGSGAFYSIVEGDFNTALGAGAGDLGTAGSYNTYIGAGVRAGALQESNTIRIGDNLPGDPGASACFIGGINGQTTTSGTAVFINSSGKLGTITSSARFKKDVKPMDSASEVILSLRPVRFHYRSDTTNTPQFGLVAEEVARMDPALVVTDKEGKPYTVRYEVVNAMLLNEFLKEHRIVQAQQATITELKKELEANAARQQKQIDALTAGLQRVSAQLEVNKAAPRTALSND
jgi:Chaperone of endosialidase